MELSCPPHVRVLQLLPTAVRRALVIVLGYLWWVFAIC